ncbi:hypothetical protein CAEBREN_12575 [Caenorhabditis brenneri]|uniref:Uncharacterized protein n=1 Tax=Caenorhabditis brenneri TaxID=135651 RepID=G0NIQ4_CAEBE|nr:hypothetical protein CAEBREN_12575 [Caenorhabditis brenneri]
MDLSGVAVETHRNWINLFNETLSAAHVQYLDTELRRTEERDEKLAYGRDPQLLLQIQKILRVQVTSRMQLPPENVPIAPTSSANRLMEMCSQSTTSSLILTIWR